MNKIQDDILSYREMCDAENSGMLQQGMSFRKKLNYSVILMSQRSNAPYNDRVHEDGITIEYEGHDIPRRSKDYTHNPKMEDQKAVSPIGTLTQNGKFIESINLYKKGLQKPEIVKVYEKIVDGIWSLKGYFDLLDYKVVNDGNRNVYRFILQLTKRKLHTQDRRIEVEHTRVIPTEVKVEVWKRDKGICVLCGSRQNLHFDHELPFSKGGTSLTAKNVRLLCMKHNLQKSAKIE